MSNPSRRPTTYDEYQNFAPVTVGISHIFKWTTDYTLGVTGTFTTFDSTSGNTGINGNTNNIAGVKFGTYDLRGFPVDFGTTNPETDGITGAYDLSIVRIRKSRDNDGSLEKAFIRGKRHLYAINAGLIDYVFYSDGFISTKFGTFQEGDVCIVTSGMDQSYQANIFGNNVTGDGSTQMYLGTLDAANVVLGVSGTSVVELQQGTSGSVFVVNSSNLLTSWTDATAYKALVVAGGDESIPNKKYVVDYVAEQIATVNESAFPEYVFARISSGPTGASTGNGTTGGVELVGGSYSVLKVSPTVDFGFTGGQNATFIQQGNTGPVGLTGISVLQYRPSAPGTTGSTGYFNINSQVLLYSENVQDRRLFGALIKNLNTEVARCYSFSKHVNGHSEFSGSIASVVDLVDNDYLRFIVGTDEVDFLTAGGTGGIINVERIDITATKL